MPPRATTVEIAAVVRSRCEASGCPKKMKDPKEKPNALVNQGEPMRPAKTERTASATKVWSSRARIVGMGALVAIAWAGWALPPKAVKISLNM